MSTTDEARATADVAKNAMMMAYSFNPNPRKKLLPVDAHKGLQLFAKKKLVSYIEECFTSTGEADSLEFSRTSLTESATQLSASIGVSGKYGWPCGAGVSASLSAEFGTDSSTKTKMSFTQRRQMAIYGDIKLPSAGFQLEELHALLEPKTLKMLKRCADPKTAKEFVKDAGPFYISQASFGATLVMTSTNKTTSSTDNSKMAAEMSAEYSTLVASVSVKAKISSGSQKAKSKELNKVHYYVLGGNPNHILNGDEPKWRDSAKLNPCIIKYTLSSVADLCLEGSTEKKNLEEAVLKYVTKSSAALAKFDKSLKGVAAKSMFPVGKKVRIENVSSGKFISVEGGSRDNAKNIRQWEKSTNGSQLWQIEKEPRTSGFKIKNLHSGHYISVQGGSKKQGNNIRQHRDDGNDSCHHAQAWMFISEPGMPGCMRIRNVHSGLNVSVKGGSSKSGAEIRQWASGGSDPNCKRGQVYKIYESVA